MGAQLRQAHLTRACPRQRPAWLLQKWPAWLLQKWPVLIVEKKVVADVANVAADVAGAVDAAFANLDFASVEGADAGGTAPAGSQELKWGSEAFDASWPRDRRNPKRTRAPGASGALDAAAKFAGFQAMNVAGCTRM